jgi:hypothetical protein
MRLRKNKTIFVLKIPHKQADFSVSIFIFNEEEDALKFADNYVFEEIKRQMEYPYKTTEGEPYPASPEDIDRFSLSPNATRKDAWSAELDELKRLAGGVTGRLAFLADERELFPMLIEDREIDPSCDTGSTVDTVWGQWSLDSNIQGR